MHRLLYISEQHQQTPLENVSDYLKTVLINTAYRKEYFYRPGQFCYQIHKRESSYFADSSYFVGVDWLIPEIAAIYIEPKLNDLRQINFLSMLLQSLEASENLDHLDSLFNVDFDQPWITIPEQKDLLSPILIVQFLKLVQQIVRKGLKKSYYRVSQNLNSRIKGKILVSHQIKSNLSKNRLVKTYCNYQDYGIDTMENQFLKLVLEFVSSYISHKSNFFDLEQSVQLKNILHYCLPAFEQVSIPEDRHTLGKMNSNPFYREYPMALRLGEYILKRFSFNINRVSRTQTTTPPFWIDMSKLFELYVFRKLKELFPEANSVTYHDTFRKKETDILIRAEGYQCVIDCKYKPRYFNNSPSLEDIRQIAGYTRLKGVYKNLSIPLNEVVKGVIVYSSQEFLESIEKDDLLNTPINDYVSLYKVGIKLPELPV